MTFSCADQEGLSGIAPNGCTAPKTVTTEGKAQPVTGVATDNANNSANDATKVSIDKGKPTIAGKADREANGNGWRLHESFSKTRRSSFSTRQPPASTVKANDWWKKRCRSFYAGVRL